LKSRLNDKSGACISRGVGGQALDSASSTSLAIIVLFVWCNVDWEAPFEFDPTKEVLYSKLFDRFLFTPQRNPMNPKAKSTAAPPKPAPRPIASPFDFFGDTFSADELGVE
jgi:hypothetical protein